MELTAATGEVSERCRGRGQICARRDGLAR